MPTIFELYARRRLGARAVAAWLNERGYRTRSGRPWSDQSVYTVLRNRTYLGEAFFRGTWHPAPHKALVNPALFDAASQLLTERGEAYPRRASNPTEYLLTGLIRCNRCGQTYMGTAATGRAKRYRYYSCFTRQRYGPDRCDADRLPADQLEDAVLAALRDTYRNQPLLEQALDRWATSQANQRPRIQEQLDQVDQENPARRRSRRTLPTRLRSRHPARDGLRRPPAHPGHGDHRPTLPPRGTRRGNGDGRRSKLRRSRRRRPRPDPRLHRRRLQPRRHRPARIQGTATRTRRRSKGGQPTGHPPHLPSAHQDPGSYCVRVSGVFARKHFRRSRQCLRWRPKIAAQPAQDRCTPGSGGSGRRRLASLRGSLDAVTSERS